MSDETNIYDSILPSTEADRLQIKKVLTEVSNAMTRIEAERDYIKDAIDDVAKQFSIPKKNLNTVVKAYHKQNIAEERAKSEEVFYLYDGIFSAKQKQGET